MTPSKYAHIHRQLLFHWTHPPTEGIAENSSKNKKYPPIRTPKSKDDRIEYVKHLRSILDNGLFFSRPKEEHAEHIVKGSIEANHRMLCFSEWNVGSAQEHASRYGHMGFGFTRRFIMKAGGRPVIYLPNGKMDPVRKAFEGILRKSKNDPKLSHHGAIIASFLKTYNRSREIKEPINKGDGKNEAKVVKAKPDDHDLRINFGGLFGNLEDKEWRILLMASDKHPEKEVPSLVCSPGHLAMIVLPDHETLAHVMQEDDLRAKLYMPGKPAVCLLTKEMLSSI